MTAPIMAMSILIWNSILLLTKSKFSRIKSFVTSFPGSIPHMFINLNRRILTFIFSGPAHNWKYTLQKANTWAQPTSMATTMNTSITPENRSIHLLPTEHKRHSFFLSGRFSAPFLRLDLLKIPLPYLYAMPPETPPHTPLPAGYPDTPRYPLPGMPWICLPRTYG